MTSQLRRFDFIRQALEGSGGFRPVVNYNATGGAVDTTGTTFLVRYPRESATKFARRNELAWTTNDLMTACSRFAGYLAKRAASRDIPHPLLKLIEDDADGKGNSISVFWHEFMIAAKARGSMLLLVDMPADLPETANDQIERRLVPRFSAIAPERLKDYAVGEDGKFDSASFSASWDGPDGKESDATWTFDRAGWQVHVGERLVDGGEHPLGECPILIFTESGDFPCIGDFAQIADLQRRMFNLRSELDEILRAQTFSLLHYHVPQEQSHQFDPSQVAEAIGTHNMLIHHGDAPGFIAPPEGPAKTYLESMDSLQQRINEIALNVDIPEGQESGIALQMRFHALNSALAMFSARIEDFERRAWSLATRWLGISAQPLIQWQRDFNLSDIATELQVLSQMQAAAAPQQMIAAQMKRIAGMQFGGLDQKAMDEIMDAIDGMTQEATDGLDEARADVMAKDAALADRLLKLVG